MKVLIVANFLKDRGGISGVVSNHYKGLKDEGYFVDIFNTKKNSIVRLFLLFRLTILVKNYDIIHIHCCSRLGFFPAFIGIIASKLFMNKRSIITYHGGAAEQFLSRYHKLIKPFLSKADEITVMSEFLQRVFSNYGINTTILRNVINTTNERRNDNFNSIRLVSIRSLSKNYNIPDICEAFILIKQDYPNATLQIVGDGDLEKSIKDDYERIDGITFLGKVSNKEINKILKANNIFISAPSFDNQPMSILEAFSCGVLVISTNVGGIPFMVKDKINGLLVGVHEPQQIKKKVDWIINNREKAKKIVNNGYKEIKKYQWASVGKKLMSLYHDS